MSRVRKIAKNTTILFLSQIISYILIFFYTIYIARYLGADGFGILSFALAFSGIFSILADLGLSTLTVREVAKDKSLTLKYLENALLIKAILAFLTFSLITLFVNLLGYPQETKIVVYLISLSIILTSMSGIFYSIFQAYEKIEYQSIGQILVSIIMFLGVIGAIYYKFDVIGFSFLYLASSGVIFIYNLIIYIYNFSIPKLDYNKQFWINIIKNALPFGITGISGTIYTYIDSVMLSLIQGNEVVGWYNAAYRIVLFLLFIPSTINVTIFPSMSQFYVSSPDKLELINEKYFKFMIIIGIPLGVGTTLLADKIILLIFGQGYINSIIALQILIWTIVFTFAGAGFVRLLEATNKQLILTKISGICMIVNILINIILIPRYGLIGASIATVLTELILIISIFKVSYNYGFRIETKKIFTDVIKIVIASLIMSVVILYFRDWNLLILSFISVLVYSLSLYTLKGIDDDDITIIKRIFRINL